MPIRLLPHAVTPAVLRQFRRTIYEHFHRHGRNLPWRDTCDPYRILVSEIMLQQTQVERVALKYEPFLARFPQLHSLAQAPFWEVLAAWQGLGYNRRALALHRLAQRLVEDFQGLVPPEVEVLSTLPGIGPATAGAVAAFAFERPVVFVETNIRRVFLHLFFPGRQGVKDKEILPLVEATLDRPRPRAWYYALMDYGAWLKKAAINPNRRSAHYQRQDRFAGSNRQLRGWILKQALTASGLSLQELLATGKADATKMEAALIQLEAEGFLVKAESGWRLASL